MAYDSIFTVEIIDCDARSAPAIAKLNLPATPEQFIDAFDRARISDSDYNVEVTDSKYEFLLEFFSVEPDLYELNHLAERLTELNADDELFFEAIPCVMFVMRGIAHFLRKDRLD